MFGRGIGGGHTTPYWEEVVLTIVRIGFMVSEHICLAETSGTRSSCNSISKLTLHKAMAVASLITRIDINLTKSWY